MAPSEEIPQSLIHDDGTIEFGVEPLLDLFVCPLCEGFFREPYRAINCGHTFCKSCLFTAIDAESYNCIVCQEYLGKNVSNFAVADRTLQDLMDKVLFPEVTGQDAVAEREFYKMRGMKRKGEAASQEEDESDAATLNPKRNGIDDLCFRLLPVAEGIASLDRPFLRTKGSIRIGQLKKYLKAVLPKYSKDNIEIICNGAVLGNELSVTFVQRTVWMDGSKELTLHYRVGKEDAK